MALSQGQRRACDGIVRMMDEHNFALLFFALTEDQVHKSQSRDENVATIIRYLPSIQSLFSRKRITRELLIRYLKTAGREVSDSDSRQDLCQKAINYAAEIDENFQRGPQHVLLAPHPRSPEQISDGFASPEMVLGRSALADFVQHFNAQSFRPKMFSGECTLEVSGPFENICKGPEDVCDNLNSMLTHIGGLSATRQVALKNDSQGMSISSQGTVQVNSSLLGTFDIILRPDEAETPLAQQKTMKMKYIQLILRVKRSTSVSTNA